MTGSARSCVAALCMCNHPAINSSDGCCRWLSTQSSFIMPQTNVGRILARSARYNSRTAKHLSSHLQEHPYAGSRLTRYVNSTVIPRQLRRHLNSQETVKASACFTNQKTSRRTRVQVNFANRTTCRIKPCITTPVGLVPLPRLFLINFYNLGFAPSTCTGSTERASIQLATSSINTSLSGLGSSCTCSVSNHVAIMGRSDLQR